MNKDVVLFEGAGRFSAADFIRFWVELWCTIRAPFDGQRGATSEDPLYEGGVEVAPGVVFRKADLSVLWNDKFEPLGIAVVSGYCRAEIRILDIREVSVSVTWTESETVAGRATLVVYFNIVKADGFAVRGSVRYLIRARRDVRKAVAAMLGSALGSAVPAAG